MIITKGLADVSFSTQKKDYPLWTEVLEKIDGDLIFFSMEVGDTTKRILPLDDILDVIMNHENLNVLIKFHDKEGTVLYRVNMYGRIKKIVNPGDCIPSKNLDSKQLVIQYERFNESIQTMVSGGPLIFQNT